MNHDDVLLCPLEKFTAENRMLLLIYRLSCFTYSLVGVFAIAANVPGNLTEFSGIAGVRFQFMHNIQLGELLLLLQGPASYLNDGYAKLDCGEFYGVFNRIDIVLASFLTLTLVVTAFLKYRDETLIDDWCLRLILLLIVLFCIPSLVVSSYCRECALACEEQELVEIKKRSEITRKEIKKVSVKLGARWCKYWLVAHIIWHVLTPALGIFYIHRASLLSNSNIVS